MELKILKDKKILFLSVQTFNYEKAIANKLRDFGAIVDYFDERPSNSIFAKGIIRFKRNLYHQKIDSYYKKILQKTNATTYDFLFVIKGEVVPLFFLEEFRKRNLNCKFIFYTWDSFVNNPNAVSILKYFDEKFTFDGKDAIQHKINFRPLFFMDEYQNIYKEQKKEAFKYHLLFLGTAHSDRYKISNSIVDWCTQNKYASYAYYFMPSRIVFVYKSLFDSTFQNFSYQKVSFKSLTIEEIIDLYGSSSVILDINHPGQQGLTMRTFEALGAGKKIITTNPDIKKYPFYNENNVFVINRENIVLHHSFFESPFEKISDQLYQEMSLSGWLKNIFIEKSQNCWTGVLK
jgi:hypothetical protein